MPSPEEGRGASAREGGRWSVSVVTAAESLTCPGFHPVSSSFPDLSDGGAVACSESPECPRVRSGDSPPGGAEGRRGDFVLRERLDLFTRHGDRVSVSRHCTSWDSYEPTSFGAGGA